MIHILTQPWPWWVSGLLLGSIVPLLYLLGGKWFGISSSLQQIGALCTPGSKLKYLREHDRADGMWLMVFVGGVMLGSFVANTWLTPHGVEFLPPHYHSVEGAFKLLAGGVLIGFGARYAGGCTSGHAVTGISNLNIPSVIATACFFTGGLVVTWLTDWLVF